MKKPELLAPAGNLEKLKFAVEYGADAVYFGCEFGSLRSFAGNFTYEQAKQGLDYLHERGKKGYVTLNIYPFSDEYDQLLETAKTMDALGADAFIVADIGVMNELKKISPRADIHISTQANTTSYQAVLAYRHFGAKRVNLARELTLEQIEQIQKQVAGQIETEVFIHGAVCFSYSGRCAISDYMTGYRANRGECKHPCRYQYHLTEEKRPGAYYPVFEDERGLYFFNCKDLALFEYIQPLISAGVDSVKIEGRMKSIHYIATTVSFYRQAIDGRLFSKDQSFELLSRIPNRGYTAGFMKGSFEPDDYSTGESLSQANAVFVGNILQDKQNGKAILEIRNKILAGETLEVLQPDGTMTEITLPETLKTTKGQELTEANNSQFILIDEPLKAFTILRRIYR